MKRKYQVFVSSTFRDLEDERREVMQALLELDCIPSGMELFPASNLDQWNLIKRVIEDCDYYLVIIAGRYGSIGPDGISYTRMEYEYAAQLGKPIIGFVHSDPALIPVGKSETDPEKQSLLADFRALVESRVVRYWDSAADLGSKVSRSLIRMIQDFPAGGWVRADQVPDENSIRELLHLRTELDRVREQLAQVQLSAPKGTEELAQGDDLFSVDYHYSWNDDILDERFGSSDSILLSWNEIFGHIAPLFLDGVQEPEMKQLLDNVVRHHTLHSLVEQHPQGSGFRVEVENQSFQTIKIQLRALGLISRESAATQTGMAVWTLTPYGDELMNQLRAVRKVPPQSTK